MTGPASASIDAALLSLVAQVELTEGLLVDGSTRSETARGLLQRARQDVERARAALHPSPGQEANGAGEAARGQGAAAPGAEPTEAFRVAVVDDDLPARKLIVHWLRGAKFGCVEHRTGGEAVEALEAAPDSVHAIVLDVMMPGMDGFDVLSRLKSNPATAAIPIIMVTAHATGEADIASGVGAGAADFITKPFSGPVLIAKVRAACEKQAAERRLRARLRSAEESATTDALTDLLNRRAFDHGLHERSAHALGHREALALVLLDLDHFKRINDAFGHEAGDRVLVHFAETLRRSVRGGDQAFRYGGEEFALLLPGCGAEDAGRILGRVRAELQEHPIFLGGDRTIVVRFSAGVATADAHNGYRVDALTRRADAALYKAKSGGRDRFEMESGSGDAPAT